MIWTQTKAIFYDAYRALRARKMFWIVLGLSGLVVALFAGVGLDEDGLSFFGWQLSSQLTTKVMSAALMYKLAFAEYALNIWLAWIASILALISTAGIFPSLMTAGAIDLMLSKPISRVRLFLTQYAAGLLFVVLQVFVFTLACFLVIGIRGGEWEFGLFVAVPLVVCFFSYLFSVCVLWGVMTRSTVAAILLTILVWFLVWGVHTAERSVLFLQALEEAKAVFTDEIATALENEVVSVEREIAALASSGASTQPTARPVTRPADAGEGVRGGDDVPATGPGGEGEATTQPDRIGERTRLEIRRDALTADLVDLRRAKSSSAGSAKSLGNAQRVLYRSKTFLPKTAETIELTGRALVALADLPEQKEKEPDFAGMPAGSRVMFRAQRRAVKAIQERLRLRSPWWVLGTSLAFEAVVLCLAGWIFCRRDY